MKFLLTSALPALLVSLSVAAALPQPPTTHLPSLTDWTKQGVSAIFNSNKGADFTNAINAFMSESIQIQFNGQSVTRDGFITIIESARTNQTTGATLTWFNSIEAPSDSKNPTAAGSVGLFFDTTITKKTPHGVQALSSDIAAVNFVIAQDSSIPHSNTHGAPVDNRRVTQLNRVSPPPTQNP